MNKVSITVSLMTILVFLAGCSAVSAPAAEASSGLNPITSSSQLDIKMGSGENVARPAEVFIYSPGSAVFSIGSGENVARSADTLASLRSVVFTSGENVVPPPDSMAYKALHPSNP